MRLLWLLLFPFVAALAQDAELSQLDSYLEETSKPWLDEVTEIFVVENPSWFGSSYMPSLSAESQAALQNRLDQIYLGRPLTKVDAAALKDDISDFYEEKDFLVDSVSIPPQEVTDGRLVVVVTLSRLGSVTFVGNKYFKTGQLEDYFRTQEGETIRLNRLTSDLALMNQNPYRRTGAVLTAGQNPGTTNVELITQERLPITVYYGWDDWGNDSIGLYRQFAGFTIGNFFMLDQTLSFQFTNTAFNKHLLGYFLDYEVPLPWRHTLSIYGGYSEVRSKKFADFFRNTGKNASGSLRYTIPVVMTSQSIHEVSFGADYKIANNNLLFSESPLFSRDTTLFQLCLGWSVELKPTNGTTTFWAELFGSPFINSFPHQTRADYDSLRPYAEVQYLYGRAEFVRNWILPRNFCLKFRALGQVATTNLLPSEQLGLGGAGTIRGYRERIFNADSGLVANLELALPTYSFTKRLCSVCSGCSPCSLHPEIPTPRLMDRATLFLFADYGYGTVYHEVIDSSTSENLLGVGPGLRYMLDPYMSFQADWGFRLLKVQLEDNIGGRFHFQWIARF